MPSSTSKVSQEQWKELPGQYQLDFFMVYDSNIWFLGNGVFSSNSGGSPREIGILNNFEEGRSMGSNLGEAKIHWPTTQKK